MTYTAEEQQEHRERLVQALCSGRFEQAKNGLRTLDGRCCLGVGCDIALEDWRAGEAVDPDLGWAGPYENELADDHYAFYAGGSCKSDVLPRAVQEFFGFKTANGHLDRPVYWGARRCDHLTELNDVGAPFGFIAGVIATGNVLLAEEEEAVR